MQKTWKHRPLVELFRLFSEQVSGTECCNSCKERTVDLLARDALDVDDPLLPVDLDHLAFPALHQDPLPGNAIHPLDLLAIE